MMDPLISQQAVMDLAISFHDCVMQQKGDADAQQAYFLHPQAFIIIPHGADISLQHHYEIHQHFTDELFSLQAGMQLTPLCESPCRVRVKACAYWQARDVRQAGGDT
jgi:hypothetical protein